VVAISIRDQPSFPAFSSRIGDHNMAVSFLLMQLVRDAGFGGKNPWF